MPNVPDNTDHHHHARWIEDCLLLTSMVDGQTHARIWRSGLLYLWECESCGEGGVNETSGEAWASFLGHEGWCEGPGSVHH